MICSSPVFQGSSHSDTRKLYLYQIMYVCPGSHFSLMALVSHHFITLRPKSHQVQGMGIGVFLYYWPALLGGVI